MLTSGAAHCHTDMMKAGRDGWQWITKFLRTMWVHEPKLCLIIAIKPPCAVVAFCTCYLFRHKVHWTLLNSVVLSLKKFAVFTTSFNTILYVWTHLCSKSWVNNTVHSGTMALNTHNETVLFPTISHVPSLQISAHCFQQSFFQLCTGQLLWKYLLL